jgi:hypothetical protein
MTNYNNSSPSCRPNSTRLSTVNSQPPLSPILLPNLNSCTLTRTCLHWRLFSQINTLNFLCTCWTIDEDRFWKKLLHFTISWLKKNVCALK